MVSLLKKLLKKEKPNRGLLGFLAASATIGMFCGIGVRPASAVTLISVEFRNSFDPPFDENNDCSGAFGTAPNCDVGTPLELEISPLIVKFDYNDERQITETTINTGEYPSIDGSEFAINITEGNPLTGNWTYTPGENDPQVKYWSTKSGPGFILQWHVDDSAIGSACANNSDYSENCLKAALPTTSASFDSPNSGLSHISFYNSDGGGGQEPEEIPESGGVISLAFIAGAMLINRWRKLS